MMTKKQQHPQQQRYLKRDLLSLITVLLFSLCTKVVAAQKATKRGKYSKTNLLYLKITYDKTTLK
jgi:hypothetical protein